MEQRKGFATALRQARRAQGMTQEDFGDVSSRTYVSSLERGTKSPTLDKISELAEAMHIHPLTLLALTWTAKLPAKQSAALLSSVLADVKRIRLAPPGKAAYRREPK